MSEYIITERQLKTATEAHAERECDGCAMNGADGAVTAPAGCDGLRDRMRELGVEVDG